MANKVIIKIGVSARDCLIQGANFLADAIRSTLGPYGANAYLEKGDKVTNDGRTIAQEFWHKDEIVNRGINLLRQAGVRTDEQVHDFTTTAITLGQAILKSAVKKLPTDSIVLGKMTGIEVINKIDAECLEITDRLSKMKSDITTKEQLVDAATVSVEDKELGKLIGETQFELGKDAVLLAEESNEKTSSIKLVKGIRIDNGFSSNLIAFDVETQSLITPKCKTLLTNHVIVSLKPITHVIKSLSDNKVYNLCIFARGFSAEAIKEAVKYSEAGFQIYPINAAYTDQSEVMKDLSAVLGGRYIHMEAAGLDDIQLSDLGYAEKIVARRWDTIITGIDDNNSQARTKGRVTELKKQFAVSESDFEKTQLTVRMAQLERGFGIVKIGGSPTRRKYLLDKAVDAVNTVRMAYRYGVVPGAGQALKTISDDLPESYILKAPIRAIYEQITSTAPKEFVIPEWVKDSVKGLQVALREACETASTFATVLIAIAQEIPKPKYIQEAKEEAEEESI